jgi:hypothetical protein
MREIEAQGPLAGAAHPNERQVDALKPVVFSRADFYDRVKSIDAREALYPSGL